MYVFWQFGLTRFQVRGTIYVDFFDKNLKVRQNRNEIFKPTFSSKNERMNSILLVFVRFLEEIEVTKKTFRN